MAKQTYVYSGTEWVPLASEVTNLTAYQTKALAQAPNRNLVINGAMQVAQRATSVASLTAGEYRTADRFFIGIDTQGTWTNSVENDAPSGSGFRKSLKMLCTTADASPGVGDTINIQQRIEGQNLQAIKKGTASAEQLTLSFWVKANVTGTYIAELYDNDNTRQISKAYTISTSGVWEYKTITFPADTTGAFDNDNALSLYILWWLGAGSNHTSGTLNNSAWASATMANRAVGQTNLASATNNYWQVTGVQLEVGDTATPFEFKPIDAELAQCQRYYYRNTPGTVDGHYGLAQVRSTTQFEFTMLFPVSLRVRPTSIEYSNIGVKRAGVGVYAVSSIALADAESGPNAAMLSGTNSTSGASAGQAISIMNNTNAAGYLAVNAEL
jgi:hypothetical protein